MKTYKIVVIPGDGIGPELVDATLEVLAKVQEMAGDFRLAYEFHEAGANYYQKHGVNISPETLEAIRQADAAMKGPVGLPGVRLPDGTAHRDVEPHPGARPVSARIMGAAPVCAVLRPLDAARLPLRGRDPDQPRARRPLVSPRRSVSETASTCETR